jgi:hypothetical protein
MSISGERLTDSGFLANGTTICEILEFRRAQANAPLAEKYTPNSVLLR